MIIALPIFIVARVQISALQKIALICVLGLGVIIVGFAVARIIVTDAQGVHPEISWLALWSSIESSVAVIVCCLASFKALFTAQRQGSSRHQGSTARRGTGKNVSAADYDDLRIPGPSRSKAIPLTSVKSAGRDTGHEQWMDDSSSQIEILGDAPKQAESR
ncbi:hypothetical protein LTR56_007474 [Elasticomyces elasticus]|nr:hypothetical protein LTR56_007474 [Elasticomyces elasticus]KAK3668204.1 hypothetical protein LTR22_000889 [Elasticomyces elasticus]KAK4921351.1 hypothetical protein LTR49_011181 [Elasticomyces elasticus]KAK5769470.1 hypothetical protein LTS12_000397 [Elasticomyces elasticus]